MRRELGQLSLADGLVEAALGATGSWSGSRRWSTGRAFERLLGEIYAAPVGRPSYGPLVAAALCLLLQQWYRLSDPGLEEALSDRLTLPPLRRPRAGRSGAGPLDPVALSQRACPAGPGRAAAGRAQPPARRARPDGQDRHPDRREPGRSRLPPAAQGRAGRAPQRPGRQLERDAGEAACSATRRTSRSTRARAWCGRRSSRRRTSRTRRRSWLWSRATSRRCMPTRATTAGGTARSWPCAASATASWPPAIGAGRSTPPAAPATGRSRRCGRRSSAASRSSSAGTATAVCATAPWCATRCSCSCLIAIRGTRAAGAEILIGVAGPMTGKDAWFGEQMQRGAALAVADINAAGGVLGEQVAADRGGRLLRS